MAGALGLAGILGRLYPLLDRRVHARDPGDLPVVQRCLIDKIQLLSLFFFW